MANGHFFPGDYFPTGASDPYALAPPPAAGLDAMQHAEFGMAPSWADHQSYLMPPDSSSAAAAAAHFDSALSSLVSSPAGGGGGDDVAIGDLIGRLGSICNGTSANNSCYSTPLSSPPRGAPPYRGCYAGGAGETGRLSRASSSKSLAGAAATAALESTEPDVSPDKMPATKGAARKRKSSAAKGKASTSLPATAAAATNASPKRSKLAADGEEVDTAAAAEEEEKADEPVRDYIHVRARRGQATDSHSLAERVRRERISERMKLLQSLVPGCNKITGKALMLDEIINYVQSLQRQVEFLSMKLSTMNPEMEYEGHYQVSKDMSHVAMPAFSSGDLASSTAFSSYTGSPTTANPFPGAFNYWDLDLHAFVQQMGATTGDGHDTQHNHPTATTTATTTSPTSPSPHYGFYGEQQQRATVNHMKVEP